MEEHRDRGRVHIGKLVFAKDEEKTFGGTLIDISASGLFLHYAAPPAAGEITFERGDAVEIVFDEMTSLNGFVVRTEPDGLGVEFAHDNESEERLIAEIMETLADGS